MEFDESLNASYLIAYLSYLDTKLLPLIINSSGGTDADSMLKLMENPPGFLTVDGTTEASISEMSRDAFQNVLKIRRSESEKKEVLFFERVARIFSLSEEERMILLACVAIAADARYGKIYSFIQHSGNSYPTADLLLRVAFPDGLDRLKNLNLLRKTSNLLLNCLIEPISGDAGNDLSTAYHLVPGIVDFVSGIWRFDQYSWRISRVAKPEKKFLELTQQYCFPLEPAEDGTYPLISYYGQDQKLQRIAGETLAAENHLGFLELNLSGELTGAERMRVMRYAFRDARLLNSLLMIRGIDGLIDSSGVLDMEISRLFADYSLPIVVGTSHKFIFSPGSCGDKNRFVLGVPFSPLIGTQRFRVWEDELQDSSLKGDISDESVRLVSGQFVLSMDQIHSAAQIALGRAFQEGRTIEQADLLLGARSSSMHHLSDLARLMPARFNKGDLILPPAQQAQVDELIAMVKNRSLVLEEWEIGKKLVSGQGISALFTGDPGTGKTLCAQVISGELGMDLFRIDLSTVVSKYIGETEKNLEKIFSEAQNSNVILFFDEADSLFGKRSDVGDSHDRYANIEVGYLLQRIETYDGLALLATNLGANLDEAFTRRIHFIIDFPFPDEATRLRLWEMMLPAKVVKSDDIDLKRLADDYKIAGGNIRNAIVCGVYNAAEARHPLCQADLLHGVEREYQKMGRVFKRLSVLG